MVSLLSTSSAAWAQTSIAIPEPTDIALFAMAVAGLVIGRQSSRQPPKDPPAGNDGA